MSALSDLRKAREACAQPPASVEAGVESILADAALVIEALRWTWQGDPELVSDDHWAAYERLATEAGVDAGD